YTTLFRSYNFLNRLQSILLVYLALSSKQRLLGLLAAIVDKLTSLQQLQRSYHIHRGRPMPSILEKFHIFLAPQIPLYIAKYPQYFSPSVCSRPAYPETIDRSLCSPSQRFPSQYSGHPHLEWIEQMSD